MVKYKAWTFLIGANLFWAGNIIFGKLIVAELPAEWTVFLRWVVGLILLIPIAQFIEKPSWDQIWRNNWVLIILLATLSIVLYTYLSYASLQFTSATNSALFTTLAPGLIMLFSLIFLREKVSAFQFIGLIISFIGVLIVLTKGNLLQLFHTQYNEGDAIMLLAVLCWTAYSLLLKKAKGIPPVTLVAMIALVGAILMIPFLFFQPIHSDKITSLGIVGVIYMGVFPSVGSFIFWNQGVKILGASKAGITMNLIPVFTAIISVILGHALEMSQMLGGLMTIAGMLLIAIKRKQESQISAPVAQQLGLKDTI
ncbi:DMT family transporter [Paenibacillus germinis]|uniref:DMT family transporter n=1 Tax=Paenibacillus germinis TaxID=2654979 RepID=UPI001C1097CB|nr:DMT family transporter [Paenibacillus germinis]